MKRLLRLDHPAVPYVTPFAIFILLTELSRWLPGSLVWLYPLKTGLAGASLAWFWQAYADEIKPALAPLGLAMIIGLVVCGVWIGLEG